MDSFHVQNFYMNSADIHKKVKCCNCEGKLPLVPHTILLPIKANWDYPTHGNILTGTSGMASSFLCDDCYRKPMAGIRFAVELNFDQAIYHEIDWEKKVVKQK